ncbi:MAG: hypothetical protein V4636_12090 [Pseudomonadota bacterium]
MTREAIFCFDTATVRFAIYPDGDDGTRVIAQIGEHPLRDLFAADGGGDTLVAAYDRHAQTIDAVAVRHYRADPLRPIVLQTPDFALECVHAAERRAPESARRVETTRPAANHVLPSTLAA